MAIKVINNKYAVGTVSGTHAVSKRYKKRADSVQKNRHAENLGRSYAAGKTSRVLSIVESVLIFFAASIIFVMKTP